MRRILLATMCAAVLLLAAGCGSGLSTRSFAAQANAICASTDAMVKTIPQPTADDLRSLAPYLQAEQQDYQSYLTQVSALARRAADRAAIERSWTDLAQSDYAAQEPLVNQLILAAQQRNAAATKSAAAALAAVSDHTAAIRAFQTKVGATECSTLLGDIGAS